MFDLLARIVQRGESFHISYARSPDDTVSLIVQPKLDGEANDTDESAAKARAALQRPRVWKGTHAQVAEAFERFVASTSDDRAVLAEAHGRLTDDEQKNNAMKAAATDAAHAAERKIATAERKADNATDPKPQAEADTKAKGEDKQKAPVSNPPSLFD